ncbi:MAG: hypothetical protein ACRDJU_01755 [Actinomycetota bacterium]
MGWVTTAGAVVAAVAGALLTAGTFDAAGAWVAAAVGATMGW